MGRVNRFPELYRGGAAPRTPPFSLWDCGQKQFSFLSDPIPPLVDVQMYRNSNFGYQLCQCIPLKLYEFPLRKPGWRFTTAGSTRMGNVRGTCLISFKCTGIHISLTSCLDIEHFQNLRQFQIPRNVGNATFAHACATRQNSDLGTDYVELPWMLGSAVFELNFRNSTRTLPHLIFERPLYLS